MKTTASSLTVTCVPLNSLGTSPFFHRYKSSISEPDSKTVLNDVMICNHLCSTFPCCDLCCACLRITSSQSRPRSSKTVICSKQNCHFLLTLHRSTCTSKDSTVELWESGDWSHIKGGHRPTKNMYGLPITWNISPWKVQALFPKPRRTEKPHGWEHILKIRLP